MFPQRKRMPRWDTFKIPSVNTNSSLGGFAPEETSGVPVTPSMTPSNTPTPSITASPTNTPTPSVTPQPTATPTNTPTSTGTPTPTPSGNPSGTTEANAYLSTVVLSGGTVSAPASAATVTFFTSLVSNGLWDKIYAFYPFLGGNSSSAQAVEGKLNYNMVAWGGGFTFSDNGVQGNGVNNYAEVGVSPNVIFGGSGQPSSLGVFVNLQGTVGNRIYDMGVNDGATLTNQSNIAVRRVTGGVNETLFDAGDYLAGNGRVTTTIGSSSGMTIGTARSASDKELYRNGSSIATSTASGNLDYTTKNFLFTCQNENNNANYFNSNRYGFMFIGSGLTDSEVSTLSTLVNDYQNALGRYSY